MIDINKYSSSIEKKRGLGGDVNKLTGLDIDFSDMQIKEYPTSMHDALSNSVIDNSVLKMTKNITVDNIKNLIDSN